MPRYVEKLRVPIQLALSGEEGVAGFFSLFPAAEHHEGPETLLERLNAPQRMLPFHRAVDGAFTLVVRERIEWLAAGGDTASELLRPHWFIPTREERVRVRTAHGKTFDGILELEMPHEFNRASDFLNTDCDFFMLATGQGTIFLNKAMVLDIRVFEAAPVPKVA
ncbi:MAG: hypothetical protein IPJ04_12045 [Candidatus Eisenbacteria bacterium]|jgi:hypothetical protein|nr:hypothetical protein [Candidatus Eisenbacteria bacterium]